MTRSQLNIDHVARVEGHGNVHVVIEDDVVKTVEMNIVEPARLFESMVRGQSYKDCSYISSRICGICSPCVSTACAATWCGWRTCSGTAA